MDACAAQSSMWLVVVHCSRYQCSSHKPALAAVVICALFFSTELCTFVYFSEIMGSRP